MTPDKETTDRSESDDEERIPDIPVDAVEETERLTRLARATERRAEDGDEAAIEEAALYRERRDELAVDHDYETRIRNEDDTLVLYPEEWLKDGTVQFDRIEETERAVEVSLSGAGDPERWQEIADHNNDLVDVVAEAAPEHVANARAFTAFASNHYAKPAEKLTSAEIEEFLEEYYPRNTWPSEAAASLVEESVRKVFAAADTMPPTRIVDE